jgi:methyl-accepting chemotaxis protein
VSNRAKLFTIMGAPLLALLFAGYLRVSAATSQVAEMDRLSRMGRISTAIGGLVHETQKERGLTAGLLGGGGSKFNSMLLEQRGEVDSHLDTLKKSIEEEAMSELPPAFRDGVQAALDDLEQLAQVRGRVSMADIEVGEAIGYFTGLNARMLDAVASIARATTEADLAAQAMAYASLLKSKERYGIERAVLSGVFAADKFGPGTMERWITHTSEEDTYAREARLLASKLTLEVWDKALEHPSLAQVEGFRDRARAGATQESLDCDSGQWFKAMTALIGQLKLVEDHMSSALIAQVEAGDSAARRARWINVSLLLLACALATGVGTWIARGMSRALGDANQLVVALRRGDFSVKAQSTGKDEISTMAQDLEGSMKELSVILADVEASAGQIDQAAGQVSNSSQELAGTTSEQAATLEQISAAMMEVSSNAQQASRQVVEATDLTRNATEIAAAGSSEMEGMRSAMTEIKESSDRVAKVIQVIDEIAFQTNLLALNAAVEAARAGESGKGFAVVAEEVRSLAMRSAEAARNTADLIDVSVRSAENGVVSSEAVSNFLTEIDTKIHAINDLMRGIGEGASAQATGATEISSTLRQLDSLTQSTAGNSEELAASAEETSSQVTVLKDMIGQFKLAEGLEPKGAAFREDKSSPDPWAKLESEPELQAPSSLVPLKAPVIQTADEAWVD